MRRMLGETNRNEREPTNLTHKNNHISEATSYNLKDKRGA